MDQGRRGITAIGSALLALCSGCGEKEREVHQPIVTSDGKTVVSIRKSGNKQFVSKGNVRLGGEYDQVLLQTVSPDGSVAFAARSGGKYTLIKDGKAVCEPRALVLAPTFGPKGKSFAFAMSHGARGEKWSVVKNGKQVGELYDRVGAPAFSPDGGSIVFAAAKDGRTYVARDGELGGAGYDDIQHLRFTPDGGSVVHVAVEFDSGKQFIVRDGRPVTDKYDRVWGWAVSADGKSMAWVARRDGFDVLVKDGAEAGEPFSVNQVVGPVFAADGSSVGFAAGHGTWFLQRDDAQLGGAFEADSVRQLLFSPDGRSLACSVVRRREAFIVKDGKQVSETYRAVSEMGNSPDRLKLTFYGWRGKNTEPEPVAVPW